MKTPFGHYLKQMRVELGLSQVELAQTIGSTQRHISFLETGRSQPTRSMLGRFVSELELNSAQRAALFDASGFHNPYKQRAFASKDVVNALDMIEKRVLGNWPFPAFVLDREWTVLRLNKAAQSMFKTMLDPSDGPLNMFDLFLGDTFRNSIENWEEASTTLYYRLQTAAADSPKIKRKFDDARAVGLFEGVHTQFNKSDDIPIYTPLIIRLPNGARLTASSLLGQLMSVQDALVEGFEIELMVPADDESEALLRMLGST